MIIGIAGTLGSGKGTVVKYLRSKKNFSHYSSSDILKKNLEERGLSVTRKNMSELADEFIKKYEGGILHASYQQAQADNAQNIILEAIHRVGEAEFVRSLGGLVLGVDADVAVRYERISERHEGKKDEVTSDQFLADSKREDEGKGNGTPNIKEVLKNTDHTIMNNGTLEELQKEVDVFLSKYGFQ